MSRIPVSASVALAGLLPVCAAALGLGEIESGSYLNQPLSAEIPVFSETASEIAGLKVELASPDTFSRYGLQQPAVPGELAFAVVPGPRGAVIRITSTEPAVEPFVTLLIEVSWPQGRLLREYTVLLDPPAFTGGAVRQPVEAPTAAAPAAAPVVGDAQPEERAPEAAQTTAGDGLHTVRRNETLWGIANRNRPGSSTDIGQVMLAIYRANPEAFAGNINRLNAGAVLRIPDRATIAGLSRAEAAAEVRRQNLEWRGGAPAQEPARLELVPPSQTAPKAAASAPPADASQSARLQSEVEESRRLVAVKDAELQALRNRVAQLEKQAGNEVAIEAEPPAAPAVAAKEPAVAAPPAATGETAARPPARPVRAASAPKKDSGILATLLSLFTSIWLWVAAAVVLVGALLVARGRSTLPDLPAWRPTTRRGGTDQDGDEPVARGRDDVDMIVIEEPGRVQGTSGVERRSAPRDDEEAPLERTISTEGPVNLDQSDPLAEADFHMAYGLYDQAADLLTAAIGREPARRDLQLKLLDVYFVWENRDGFLKEARALREHLGNDMDPDWKRVIIMGKQLCPTEAMFAGAATPAAYEMDLALGGDTGGTVDQPLGATGGGLDFDLSGDDGADFGASSPLARSRISARTQEFPTIEAPAIGSGSTMETPTIASASLSSTMASPTLKTPVGERTMETPTVETWSPDVGNTASMPGLGDTGARADQTEEIDLEDLGLDLTGLDEAAHDMATGLQEAISDADNGLDFDLSGELIASPDNEESTAELEKNPTLGNLAKAMGKESGGFTEETAEQPGIGDPGATRSGPTLSMTNQELESLNVDFESSGPEIAPLDLTATGLRALRERRPEDPTMTEVGTKLDLARAYVDMGDPDGARSILNEVLEEGDPAQCQEARQLLDGLNG